ncbi:MAG TPA: winged helix-turn-helix domain-containing protein [Vicinamibacterales bacterium]|nr:winged helix-turn-helix domain-containing protein [Vicinamibacterales bacterium]
MPDVVCFGPFELDTRTGELLKKGKRIRLPPQPASLLSLLATRSGQLVTRDEIRRHLWGGSVFVEYERSLNACLAHLRSALGDRAHAPRYIETLPRRGYRFIAAVHRRRPFLQPTVAVLPFANLTGDPALEHFADGVTDALITELASISALRVISHQSVRHLKGSSRTLAEIASELGADALLEGSATCDRDRVCVNVQLVAPSPERHLWAKAYECPSGEIIAVHRQVARAVADIVDAALTPAERNRLSRSSRLDLAAQEAYVKGCYYATQWTAESCSTAVTFFEEAITRDPGYVPAHVALSRTLFNLAYWGYLPLKPTLTRAREAAVAALARDEGLAAAHTAMAYLHWFHDWNLVAFRRELDRALELSPSDPEAHILAALFSLTLQDDRERAFADAEFALRLDPLSQSTHFLLAWCYLFGGELSRALDQARKTLDLFPDSLHAWYAVGLSQLALGRRQEAVVALEKAASVSREAVGLGYLGCAYAQAGRLEDARALLDELLASKARHFVPLKPFIILYLALGETDCALAALEEAYEMRDPILFGVAVTPPFAMLRGHPRFEALLERLPTHAGHLQGARSSARRESSFDKG